MSHKHMERLHLLLYVLQFLPFVSIKKNTVRMQFALLNWTETDSTVLFILTLIKKILELTYHSLSANIKVITFEHICYQLKISGISFFALGILMLK